MALATPSGAATMTAPRAAAMVDHTMGANPKRPSNGYQASSNRNLRQPPPEITGQDSRSRNRNTNRRMAAAAAEHAASGGITFQSACQRNEVLLFDEIIDFFRLRKIDELLDQTLWRLLGHEIQRPRQRELAVAHVCHRGCNTIHGEQLDGSAGIGLVFRGTNRDVPDRIRIGRNCLDILRVVTDDDTCFDFAVLQSKEIQEQLQRRTPFSLVGNRDGRILAADVLPVADLPRVNSFDLIIA